MSDRAEDFVDQCGELIEGLRSAGLYPVLFAPFAAAPVAIDWAASRGATVVDVPFDRPLGRAVAMPLLVASLTEAPLALVHVLRLAALPAVAAAARVAPAGVVLATLDRPAAAISRTAGRLPAAFRGRAEEAALRAIPTMARHFLAPTATLAADFARWIPGERLSELACGFGVSIDAWVSQDEKASVNRAARRSAGLESARFVVGVAGREATSPSLDALARANPFAELVTAAGWGAAPDRRVRVLTCDERTTMEALDVLVDLSGPGVAPSAAMKAALCRIPVVGWRAAGTRDVVLDEQTGLLVDPGDHAALGRAVKRLLDRPGEREEYGARARQLGVRIFDRDLALRRVFGLYDELLGGAGPTSARLTADGQIIADPGL